jgi:hypothetical protein
MFRLVTNSKNHSREQNHISQETINYSCSLCVCSVKFLLFIFSFRFKKLLFIRIKFFIPVYSIRSFFIKALFYINQVPAETAFAVGLLVNLQYRVHMPRSKNTGSETTEAKKLRVILYSYLLLSLSSLLHVIATYFFKNIESTCSS